MEIDGQEGGIEGKKSIARLRRYAKERILVGNRFLLKVGSEREGNVETLLIIRATKNVS